MPEPSQATLINYNNGIYCIDAQYVRPNLAAIHMLVEGQKACFIDTGTTFSLPNALAALDKTELAPADVEFVILTHVHLDHAGGAAAMMEAFPQAKLLVHHRGSRHMADPSKLVAGVIQVYGSEYVAQMYGEIKPIDPQRITAVNDGDSVRLNGTRELRFLDTAGHARHHICIHDQHTGSMFTGDMCGLSYKESQVNGKPFAFPTTTPNQFDPDAMLASLERIAGLHPSALYLTHFGQIDCPEFYLNELTKRLTDLVSLSRQEANLGQDELSSRLQQSQTAYLLAELAQHGCLLDEEQLLDIWGGDVSLNVQGIMIWLESQHLVKTQ